MINKTLTKKALAEKINNKLGYSKEESKEFVDSFFNIIIESINKEKEVKIPELGNFYVRKKNERIGRNPKTGVEAKISSRKVASFKPSRLLRKKINS